MAILSHKKAKVTAKERINARTSIAAFVEGNIDRLNGWLDTIEQEDGAKAAFESALSVVEYHVPKLARVENKHEGSINMSSDEAMKTMDRILKARKASKAKAL